MHHPAKATSVTLREFPLPNTNKNSLGREKRQQSAAVWTQSDHWAIFIVGSTTSRNGWQVLSHLLSFLLWRIFEMCFGNYFASTRRGVNMNDNEKLPKLKYQTTTNAILVWLWMNLMTERAREKKLNRYNIEQLCHCATLLVMK